MSASGAQRLCPEPQLAAILATMRSDETLAIRDLERLLDDYPRDPRLHFLKGSLLASQQEYAEARKAMRAAVDIAPDYAIARFQLGFLLLTSGDAVAAQEAWGPLHALPADNYLRIFVEGLTNLIVDKFDETIRVLEDGMRRNKENPAMNRDMQLIIDEIRRKPRGDSGGSSVDLLLQQAALRTRH
jgi:tetratricopeptide (TPR) repeat protein